MASAQGYHYTSALKGTLIRTPVPIGTRLHLEVKGLSSPRSLCWLCGRTAELDSRVVVLLLKRFLSRTAPFLGASPPLARTPSPSSTDRLGRAIAEEASAEEEEEEEEEEEGRSFLQSLPPRDGARVLIYYCPAHAKAACGGLADRLIGALSVFLLAVLSRRQFVIDWTHPVPLATLLQPTSRYNWDRAADYPRPTAGVDTTEHREIVWLNDCSLRFDSIADFDRLFPERVIRIRINVEIFSVVRGNRALRASLGAQESLSPRSKEPLHLRWDRLYVSHWFERAISLLFPLSCAQSLSSLCTHHI
jgi:hypothetical protein